MSTPTLQESIQKLREDFRIKQKQAEIALKDKIAKALDDLQKSILKSLMNIHDSVKDLGKEEKELVLADESIKSVLSSLGYVRRKTKDGSTRSGGSYDEAAILAFLADGPKEQKLLIEKFGVSKQSIGAWGKKLVKAGKVKITKNGRERVWSKV